MQGLASIAATMQSARGFAVPAADRVAFQVKRHGSIIGMHQVVFEQSGSTLRAKIDCKMRVKFGPITLFRYHHKGIEQWADGKFVSLETETDNDGTPLGLSARATPAGVTISTHDGKSFMAPPNALPLTHWNVACMNAPLFNPQDGTMLPVTAACEGHDTVTLADGSAVPATRYTLKGEAPIEDWYDGTKTWTALRAKVKDGSTLDYQRTA
jgi:hypothetical protein